MNPIDSNCPFKHEHKLSCPLTAIKIESSELQYNETISQSNNTYRNILHA